MLNMIVGRVVEDLTEKLRVHLKERELFHGGRYGLGHRKVQWDQKKRQTVQKEWVVGLEKVVEVGIEEDIKVEVEGMT